MNAGDDTRYDRFADRIRLMRQQTIAAGEAINGVRFLYGPRESLNYPNGNVVLGINPGGEQDESDRWWTPRTAYLSEVWTNGDYQYHVRTFMRVALTIAGATDWEATWDASLTSNLFPFRSRGVSDIPSLQRNRFFKFGEQMWRDVFAEIRPRAIVAFGKPTRDAVLSIFESLHYRVDLLQSFPTNKPGSTAELYAFHGGQIEGRALLAPHYARGHGVRQPGTLRQMAEQIAPFLRV